MSNSILLISFVTSIFFEKTQKSNKFFSLFKILRKFKIFANFEDNSFETTFIFILRKSLNFEFVVYDISISKFRIYTINIASIFIENYLEIDETFEYLKVFRISLLFFNINEYYRQLQIEQNLSSIN